MDNFTINKLDGGKIVVFSPYRVSRPSDYDNSEGHSCPFCTQNVDRSALIKKYNLNENHKVSVSVIKNSYPFSDPQELIIPSAGHSLGVDELSLDQLDMLFDVYRDRFISNKALGQVVIFHNHGELSGASIKHAHTQLAVLPSEYNLNLLLVNNDDIRREELVYDYGSYVLLTPSVSQFGFETWIVPKNRGRVFYQITDTEIEDLAKLFKANIKVLRDKLGDNVSYNFIISPKQDWYLRIIPRLTYVGGFELATDYFVNTQNPEDVMLYMKNRITKVLNE